MRIVYFHPVRVAAPSARKEKEPVSAYTRLDPILNPFCMAVAAARRRA
jgi:hypothetical protein